MDVRRVFASVTVPVTCSSTGSPSSSSSGINTGLGGGGMGRRKKASVLEVVACSLEFVEALVRDQHLPQRVVPVGPSPWSLDGRDVS